MLLRVVQRVLGTVLATIMAVSLLLTSAASASAYANGETAATKINIIHKAKFNAPTSPHVTMSKLNAAHDCCDKGDQAEGCSTAHCFGCAAALSAPESHYAIDSFEIGHVWPEYSAPVVAEPAPDFRPPRLTA